jgi:hypothetical protein
VRETFPLGDHATLVLHVMASIQTSINQNGGTFIAYSDEVGHPFRAKSAACTD